MTARIWGAHAARVLVSASSPKQSSCKEVRWVAKKKKKFAMTETPSPAREGACAPQITAAAQLNLTR
jgi:hypothetical protein